MPTTFAVDELNFCVRYGNRWILIAIITGMAPLVGLEAEGDFEKGLKMSLLCAKTAQKWPFFDIRKIHAPIVPQGFLAEKY